MRDILGCITFYAVLRIRILRVHIFLGLPDPDPLVRETEPDPSIIKQKYQNFMDPQHCFYVKIWKRTVPFAVRTVAFIYIINISII
jgi:hypothetical protein